ncbi:MAG: FecR domain-containing protein, partial [Ideonella sp.]|nr:FecR domain-containing protein [Ideonella sp.]
MSTKSATWRRPVWPVAAAVAMMVGGAGWVGAAAAQGMPVPQIASERDEAADPPGRAGRVAEVQGTVWLFHPEVGEWMAAERNRPLTGGDRLSTEAGGRIEVRIGSTALRLDANTELEVVELDDDRFELALRAGSLAVRVRTAEAARELLLTTDDGRFTVSRPGRYRLDRVDDASVLTVWSGQAGYEANNSALTVQAGQRAEFWLDRHQRPQYSLGEPRSDAFAAWASELDRNADRSVASRYVSPEMTGAEDLDRYGRWEQDPEYGALWLPREVPVGWAPYSQGHWSWVAPWGWTWVDAAPWGFAPFHYGRWVYVRNSWCWTPGRY